MGKMWERGDKAVERTLREGRPRPTDEFVDAMTSRVQAGSPRRREWSRVSFAAALVVFMVGTFASFGGLGYAGSGAIGSAKVVKHVVVPVKHQIRVKVRTYSSASDQYGKVKTVVKTVTKPVVEAKVVGSKPTIQPTTVKGETLPFTGFSLLGTVVLGLALVGLGVFLRRREAGDS
jgi:hypothetical protein